jgi:hypothetical protein
MKKLMAAAIALAIHCPSVFAQLQSADGEGVTQAATLKKLTKKAKYGAYSVQSNISFSTGKGIDGSPVVTAAEDGTVDMVAMEDKAVVGFMLPYNQFVKLTDYDFFVYYKNAFKSQKYPPEKVSLTNDDIFLDDSYGQFYGFKAEESGQRCRFKYNYQYTDAKYLTRVFFHDRMPVKEKSISFKVPSWLQLDITEKNFANYKIRKEVKKEKDFTTYTYTGSNLPAIHEEASSLSRPYYLPHLIITVRDFTVGGKAYNGFKTLDDMYAWYNLLYKKADNKADVLKSQVTQLTQGKASDEEKVKSIYYWVQDNIRYIAFEEGYSGFVPESVQEVYKNKYSDCKGMANLMTEMLKTAGYDAHFSWIGTKDIPYDRTEIQSMCVDNHAISVLYLKGKTYFLDGTEKYAPFGKNAYRIQGKKVLVQNGDSYKIELVPAASVEDNQINTKALLALDGDKIKGHVKLTFDGETRNLFHYIYNNIPANRRKDFINQLVELNNDNTEATNIKTSDFKNRDIPLVLEGDIEISNQVTQVDKLSYTGIDFFPGTITGYIPKDDRENPIDINRVFTTNDEVVLQLPASSKAISLPKNFDAAFNNNSIKASYSATGNKITLTKQMKLSTPVIYNNDFTAWKGFINQVKEFNRSNVAIQLH